MEQSGNTADQDILELSRQLQQLQNGVDADHIARLWESLIDTTPAYANLQDRANALSDALNISSSIGKANIRALFAATPTAKRKRRDVIRLLTVWGIWPWELTKQTAGTLGIEVLDGLVTLAERGASKQVAGELLTENLDDRLKTKRQPGWASSIRIAKEDVTRCVEATILCILGQPRLML